MKRELRRISCSSGSTIFGRALYRLGASSNEDNWPSYILDRTSVLEDSRRASMGSRLQDKASS